MRVMEIFGTSMTAVAQNLSKSIENMTRACIMNDSPFYHQSPAPHVMVFSFMIYCKLGMSKMIENLE